MQNNVKIINEVSHEKIPCLIDNSDIFLYASSSETFGLGLLEGMARGAKIICADLKFYREILGDNCFFFNINDPHSIAKSIIQIINNQNEAAVYAKYAYEKSKQYTWENVAERTYNFISNFINE
jgi:glycosyltransferase involved in cell wall biosynthesis